MLTSVRKHHGIRELLLYCTCIFSLFFFFFFFFGYCAQNDTRAGLMFLSLPHHILSIHEIYLRFLILLTVFGDLSIPLATFLWT